VLYELVRIRREGVPAPRWQISTLPVHRGELCVEDRHISDLGRTARVARLVGVEDVPPLVDVVLLKTQGDHLVLTGFERTPNKAGEIADFAQTWLLRGSHGANST